MALKTYEAIARKESDDRWIVAVPELNAAEQRTSFSGILTTASDIVSFMTGLEPGKFSLRLVI